MTCPACDNPAAWYAGELEADTRELCDRHLGEVLGGMA